MNTKHRVAVDVALLLARVAVGLYFTLAGIPKVRGEISNGLGNFYRSSMFKSMQPAWLPDALAAPFGYALPWLEVILGIMLVLGLFTTIVAVLIGLILLSITIAAGLQHGIRATPQGPFAHTYFMIVICLLLALLGPGVLALDRVVRRKKAG